MMQDDGVRRAGTLLRPVPAARGLRCSQAWSRAQDAELCRVGKEYLPYYKIGVTLAQGADEGRAWLDRGEFAATVIDGDLSGADQLQSLVPVDPDRVVLLYAQGRPESWLHVGLRHSLKKPFDIAELQSILAGILSRADARRS